MEPVEVRVGVNTGETLVRLDVEPASGEGFLTGDAVNVAARLQAAAPPMAVAVGEATHAVTENVFAFDDCHPVTLKGKRQPLQVWIATAPLARTGSELRSFTTSFVGREAELGALGGATCMAQQRPPVPASPSSSASPASARAACWPSWPGASTMRSTIVTWRQGRCLPFGSNVTFWALSEIVRSCAGILESDGVARARGASRDCSFRGQNRELLRAQSTASARS